MSGGFVRIGCCLKGHQKADAQRGWNVLHGICPASFDHGPDWLMQLPVSISSREAATPGFWETRPGDPLPSGSGFQELPSTFRPRADPCLFPAIQTTAWTIRRGLDARRLALDHQHPAADHRCRRKSIRARTHIRCLRFKCFPVRRRQNPHPVEVSGAWSFLRSRSWVILHAEPVNLPTPWRGLHVEIGVSAGVAREQLQPKRSAEVERNVVSASM